LLGVGIEAEVRGESPKLSTPKRPEEGFCDITLESPSPDSKVQSEVQSPLPSFNYLAPGQSPGYFTDRVTKLASKESSFYDKSYLNATRDETNQSLYSLRLCPVLHFRYLSADQQLISRRESLVRIQPTCPCGGDVSLPSPLMCTTELSSIDNVEEGEEEDMELTFGED
jgi:hypothetical protein